VRQQLATTLQHGVLPLHSLPNFTLLLLLYLCRDAGAEELERVRQQLATTLQLALASTAAAAGAALSRASGTSGNAAAAAAAAALHPLPVVAQSTAFSGCYQLVFELVRPTGAGSSEQQQQSHELAAAAAGGAAGSASGTAVQLAAVQAEAELAEQQLEQLQHFLEQQVRQQLPAGWDVRGIQMVGKSKKDLPATSSTGAAAAAGTERAGSGGKAAKERSSRRHKQPQQLTAVATAAAANSLAAALACLWSRDGDGQRGGITLHPLAAALPEQATTPTAAAEGAADSPAASLASVIGSRSSSSMVEVELLLSKLLVEQLLEQGHERVRCVVAVQPQGAVLLDQVWELLSSAAAAAAAAGKKASGHTAADDLTEVEVTAARGATADAPSAAAAVTEDGLKLQLSFSRDAALQLGSEMSKQGPVRVLSVVVLAKNRSKDRNRPCSSSADSISSWSRSTGSTGSSMLAAAAAAAAVSGAVVPGVIEHLPLLLLPGSAATEMQGVFEAAVACGVDRLQANQQLLLRLVQDWALLMLLLDGTSGSDGSSSSSNLAASCNSTLRSPLQLMQQSLNDSLSSYFAQHKLEHCLKLLQSVAGAASSSSSSSGNSSARAARLQRQQQQAAQQQQQQQTYKAHFSAEFYLYTFKIANCTAQHPHDWSTVSGCFFRWTCQ
jgi:hypothetical protein